MNDEPFIIGGFISDEKRVNYDRFPFLSELPLLGNLFRNRQITDSKSELIFVITPHIVYPSRTPLMVWTADELATPLTFTDRPY
jgi:Flp pilus assembly secretin CpaC